MNPQKKTGDSKSIYELAVELSKSVDAEALLVLVEGPADWEQLQSTAGKKRKLLVVADDKQHLEGAIEADIQTVLLTMTDAPVYDKLTQALLQAVAEDILEPGADVVAVYSGFEVGTIDSFSYIRLDERLGRLTSRDLRRLVTKVPLDTLRTVVDLAVGIGHEGREGKPVGTLFVVGDHRKVLASSQLLGFDPVYGYKRSEKNLQDRKTREAIKEIAQLDGAIIIASDGTVEAACRMLDAHAASVTLSKGLGTRHWAAAAITKKTNAIAVAVSESNGTVRLFQNGEVVLRIEPGRRAMKWKDFDYEPPQVPDS